MCGLYLAKVIVNVEYNNCNRYIQFYNYTGQWWSGETTTKLLFSVKSQDSRGKSVQLYNVNCEMFLPNLQFLLQCHPALKIS